MCGRYTLTQPGEVLLEMGVPAEEVDELSAELAPRYNIAPTQHLPVVVAREGQRHVGLFRWGLVPFWAKDPAIGNQMINARSETVPEKPAFKNAFKRRRCLVPADGFYEWQKQGTIKQPFHFHLADRRPFALAGLWEHWDKGSEPLDSFTILTTQANAKIAPYHDRMPVILLGEAQDRWLNPLAEEQQLQALFTPLPPELLGLNPVSRMVNDARIDRPECAQPLAL